MKEPLRFHALDVFTHSKFAGKPLVVFENADGLARGEMAALAREFNLPAAFACASRDPVNSASIRVFTPQGEERSFSAQAVIGVAISLARSRAAEILARREVVVVLEIADEIFSCEVIKKQKRRPLCAIRVEPRGATGRRGAGRRGVGRRAGAGAGGDRLQGSCAAHLQRARALCLRPHRLARGP